jgi:hypothetical protein
VDARTRAVIAYIAGRLIAGSAGWTIQDKDRKRRVALDGWIDDRNIRIYSHERHGYISGLGAEGHYVLFHHASDRGLTLAVNVEARTFSGADQQTSYHFLGDVAERAIRLYDYQDMRWHLYTL